MVLLATLSFPGYIGAGEFHIGDVQVSGYSGYKQPELIETLENKDTWQIGEIDPSQIWLTTTLESSAPLKVRMRVYLRMKVGTIKFAEEKGINITHLKQSAVWGKQSLVADEHVGVSNESATKYVFRYSLDALMGNLVKANRWPVALAFTFKAEGETGVSAIASKTLYLIPDKKRGY